MQRILSAVCCLAFVAGAVAEETLETIEKNLSEASKKLTSFTSDTTTVQNMTFPGGQGYMKAQIKGKMEWLRKGEKVLFRIEQKGENERNFGGQAMKEEVDSSIVCDGDFMYTVQDMMGQKRAIKLKADPKAAGDSSKMIEGFKDMGEVKVLPDEKFDNADCYCIQVTMAAQPTNPMAKQKFWFRKDIGVLSKMEAYNDAGEAVATNTTTNIKLGATLDETRFKFVLPEGVEMMDMSAAQP